MPTFRVQKTRDYTVMSNAHFRDTRLSLKAKGLLSFMLSLPEDWDYTEKGLVATCSDGRDSLRPAIKELEKAGYLVRSRTRDSHGRVHDTEYVIYEIPQNTNDPDDSGSSSDQGGKEDPCVDERKKPKTPKAKYIKPMIINDSLQIPVIAEKITYVGNPTQVKKARQIVMINHLCWIFQHRKIQHRYTIM